MTGDRMAHPLLISLANLRMDFRMKASNRAFVLLALLPVPKFIHKNARARGVLEGRLTHECLDFVLAPLKTAARIGIMMADPWGGRRYCFMPLAGYIMDYQEAIVIAGVCGHTSPVTMAMFKQFGDPFRHPPRTGTKTLSQLAVVRRNADPDGDVVLYFKEAKKYRLNGVNKLFWRDWPLADPHVFLTPEPLHFWHKMFWDHDAEWCINVLGAAEIDFRFSVLRPHIGYRHFNEGISKLKQVTGREHRDVQRYMVGVIAGAASKEFVLAIRALMDFRYLAQAPAIDEHICDKIEAALALFHANKTSIMAAGARVGKGNHPITDWYIPKLELLQSVVPNIRLNGVVMQWSADITEHCHITEVKDPAHAGNNQNYESQISRHLDRMDKVDRFDLATSVREAGLQFGGGSIPAQNSDEMDVDLPQPHQVDTTSGLLNEIDPVSNLAGTTRDLNNYFNHAERLQRGEVPNALVPFRTFATKSTAFHLIRDPCIARIPVDQAADLFRLEDLRPALADLFQRISQGNQDINFLSGRRHARPGCQLPFDTLHIWTKLRLQSKSFHDIDKVLPAQTINASPPADDWEYGRFDTVLVNTDICKEWPRSGLEGELYRCLLLRGF